MKFNIKQKFSDWAFVLFKQNESTLFTLGSGNDICIMKENYKNQCYCFQESFDYQGKEKVLVGKDGMYNQFEVKRIQVWQMQ